MPRLNLASLGWRVDGRYHRGNLSVPCHSEVGSSKFSFPTDSKRKTKFNETTYHPKSTTHLEKKQLKKHTLYIILDMFLADCACKYVV